MARVKTMRRNISRVGCNCSFSIFNSQAQRDESDMQKRQAESKAHCGHMNPGRSTHQKSSISIRVSSVKDRLLESEVLEIILGTFERSSLCGPQFIAHGSYVFLFSVRLVRILLAHIGVTGMRRPGPLPSRTPALNCPEPLVTPISQ